MPGPSGSIECYPPNKFVTYNLNASTPSAEYPDGAAGRVRFTCKGDKARMEWDLGFSNTDGTGLHASPDNAGKGKASFSDGSGGNVSRERGAGAPMMLTLPFCHAACPKRNHSIVHQGRRYPL